MSSFAKQALSLKHAYVAALLSGTALAAMAQTPPAVPPGADQPMGMQQRGMRQGGMHGDMRGDKGGMMGERMQAQMAKRQAELKAKLKLTPEQEAAWTSFAAAHQPPAAGMHGMAEADRAAMAKLSTPERIDKMRTLREQHHADMAKEMDKRGEATKAFYNQLTPEQKKVFDTETLKLAQHRHGAGQMGGHQH